MKRIAAAFGAWIALGAGATTAHAMTPQQAEAEVASMRLALSALRPELRQNPFGRPMHIESAATDFALRGDVHGLLDHPFERVRSSLSRIESWCDVLTLPFNVLGCRARADRITVLIGRKPDSPLHEATALELRFAVDSHDGDLLKVHMTAPDGPAGTRDYRITFTAIREGTGSFVYLAYGYSHGLLSRMAMQAYLSTSGAGKVGFSTVGVDDRGRPVLVGGLRGVIERNTMRYFLAIEAYLDSLEAPPSRRLQARLERWFSAVQRYPRQLAEMSRDEYLELKTRAAARDRMAAR